MRIVIKTDEIHFEIERDYEMDFPPHILNDMITKVSNETIKIKESDIKNTLKNEN